MPGFGDEIHLPEIVGFQITRFMVMELIAALLIAADPDPAGPARRPTRVTRGPVPNIFEAIILFIRDGIARAGDRGGHGHHEHGHDEEHGHEPRPPARCRTLFLPFLWTMFFFVLFSNLLGMIPGGASATGNINVTGVLALLTLGAVLTAGIKAIGAGRLLGQHRAAAGRADGAQAVALGPDVRHRGGRPADPPRRALRAALRQHAGRPHRAGGDPGFIAQAVRDLHLPGDARRASLGVVALSLLELFVAFLQAYIFTFLSALFIGSAVHPH